MSIDKQAAELLIANGQLVADTLRHLANNEIDSDYFAIVSESENGTETEHELTITDYALQAAGTVDELVKALEAAEKRISSLNEQLADCREIVSVQATGRRELRQRIAELEARTLTVKLQGYAVRESHPINEGKRGVMFPKDGGPWFSRFDVEHALHVVGIQLKVEE